MTSTASTNPGTTQVVIKATPQEKVAARLPDPICWTEGMLLTPQHFQQNDVLRNQQLHQFAVLNRPFFWGVHTLEFDCLNERQLIISRLKALMPDGFVLDYASDHGALLELDVQAAFKDPSVEKLTVQLVIAKEGEASAAQTAAARRYVPITATEVDNTTGEEGNAVELARLRPQFFLAFGDEVTGPYVSLPLFRLRRFSDSSINMDPDYMPPLVRIAADNFRTQIYAHQPDFKPVQVRVVSLLAEVRRKARKLAGLTSEGEESRAEVDARRMTEIRALVADLPMLEVVAENDGATPHELYQGLVKMAGSVSELDPTYIPRKFARYEHDNALPQIDSVVTYIEKLVRDVTVAFESHLFDKTADQLFRIKVQAPWHRHKLFVELRPGARSSMEELASWVTNARIATNNTHPELRKARLRGCDRQQVQRDENSGLTPALGNVMFELEKDPAILDFENGSEILIQGTQNPDGAPDAIKLHISQLSSPAAGSDPEPEPESEPEAQ